MTLRSVLRVFLALALGIALPSLAKAPEPFLNASLEEAQKNNRYVLIHFYADWCPSCQAQKKILNKVMVTDDDLRKVTFLVVPYDEDLSTRKFFAVDRQSTLIVLKGKRELAREAGTTDKIKLLAFLKTHISGD